MTLHAPQLIFLALLAIGVGVHIARFGQPKKPDTHDLCDVLVGPGITLGLLWWGGFFG
jgi:hypothetical protein